MQFKEPGEEKFKPKSPNITINQINDVLKSLGSGYMCEEVPERIQGTEILRDKTIVMVDDQLILLKLFAPELVVATDNKARFIEHTNQKIEDLVTSIMETKADIVLLDYSLASGIKGPEVARALLSKGFSDLIIGFSTHGNAEFEFEASGALGSIKKENPEKFPGVSVKALANFLITQQIK